MKTMIVNILIALAMLLVCSVVAAGMGKAMNDSEIPTVAPKDSVMASPQEIQQTLQWVCAAFTGDKAEEKNPAIDIEVRRQDYNTLHFGQSCMGTTIKIGKNEFEHGLGTQVIRYKPVKKLQEKD